MKKCIIKPAFVLLILTVLSSCATRRVSMQVLVPAGITIPSSVTSVAIVNRSLPPHDRPVLNILEGFISGESVLADREGSFNCIRGVQDRLNESPRIKAITVESDEYRGTGTKQFPVVLDWEAVGELCRSNQVDAVLSLETFDSDFELHRSTSKQKEKVNGREVVRLKYKTSLEVDIHSGWRLYDNLSRKVIDQVVFTDSKSWSGEGDSEKEALENLPSKRHVLNEAGRFAGIQMANRISPNWITESRRYFVKGSSGLENGRVHVKFNDWDAARKVWLASTNDQDPKAAGRACYNLALAAEMQGDLDSAIQWAEKAMKEFHLKQARDYVDRLYIRRDEEQRLLEQMKQ